MKKLLRFHPIGGWSETPFAEQLPLLILTANSEKILDESIVSKHTNAGSLIDTCLLRYTYRSSICKSYSTPNKTKWFRTGY